jgi:hypothetical protein
MANRELTRRRFIEIAGAAATVSQLQQRTQLEALARQTSDAQDNLRMNLPVNRDWRFMRQATPGSAVEARFISHQPVKYG